MKKIMFLTLYDSICLGVRLLSSISRNKGIETELVIFKKDVLGKPIFWGINDKTYTYFNQGILRGAIQHIDPPSEKEINLLIKLIDEKKPDLLCLSTRSFALDLSRQLILKIKNKFRNITIIAGGWGPTVEPDRFLEFVDAVCIGEGEKAFIEIIERLKNNKSIKDIPNIIFSNEKKNYVKMFPPLTEKEMSELPFPDFDLKNKYLISNNRLKIGKEFYNESIYDCFAGRGCPMNCSYCMSGMYKKIYDNYGYKCPKYRLRNVEVVIQEIYEAKLRGAKYIRIKDEVFPWNKKWINSFIKLYKEKIDLPFFAYIRPEFHDKDTINRLIKCGLSRTTVGVQSGSDFILNEIFKRKLKKDVAIEFADILKKNDVEFEYHLISHNPFETEKELKETLKFCYELPYAPMNVFRLSVLPNTPIKEMIENKKPNRLPQHVYDWYSILYCMATYNSRSRTILKFIIKYRLLKKWPNFLQIYFLNSLFKEKKNRLRAKRKLNTSGSNSIPFNKFK